ncbi:MAG: bifunctional homocysteine S-methyltransferase/methylenetetrahydrofolate reductase [Sedimentisphaerales bacterium]|nr:bifunctional homocysteine S-methyltransferase/methylenetetrahydrofolate reductase [Sedimentisphaerales bacterium]
MSQGSRLLDKLADGVVLGDGAMGTMLYSRGVFLNRCFEQLNIDSPQMVRQVHQGYVDAGVDFIETNTFGANRLRLGRYGLAGEVQAINSAAVRIAREVAGKSVMVAGAIGPLGVQVDPTDPEAGKIAMDAFLEQAHVLADSGVDFLMLETFSDLEEILIAIRASTQTGLPIVAQMTVDDHHQTAYGVKAEVALSRLATEEAVVAVGLNCSTGPASMLACLEGLVKVVDKPISVQPNAGMPRQVDGRMIYMSTPEYMAEFAKRFYQLGARIIGGCCGTTPEHIRQVVSAVKAMQKAFAAPARPSVVARPIGPARPSAAVPFAQRSNWAVSLAAGRPVTTIELTAPRGTDVGPLVQKARLCAKMGIDAVNIPDGPRASCRLSPMITALQIQQKAGIEAILHVCCRDRNLIGMQSDILGAAAIGIRNLLIITGDPPKVGEYPHATGVFDLDSISLTRLVAQLNTGIDLGGNSFSPPTSMVIGVGANPTAISLAKEVERFRQKVQAGAEFTITQPVFDPADLFRFLDQIQDCKIPVIAGIWPLTSLKNAEFMANEVPGVRVPEVILERMAKPTTKADAIKVGCQIAIEMIEKVSAAVQGLAVSAPFGNVKIALAVLGKITFEELLEGN